MARFTYVKNRTMQFNYNKKFGYYKSRFKNKRRLFKRPTFSGYNRFSSSIAAGNKFFQRKVLKKFTGRSGFIASIKNNMFANKVYRTLHPEFKNYTVGVNDQRVTAFTSSYVTSFVQGIAQGNGINQRIGGRIVMKGVFIKFFVYVDPDDTAHFWETFRIVVVRDINNYAVTLSAGTFNANDIFNDGGSVYNEMSYQFPSTSPRWQILWDSGFQYLYTARSADFPGIPPGIYYKSVYITSPMVVTYDGNAGLVSDVNSNMIYIIAWSSSALNDTPYISWTARIRYLDC